MSTLGCRRRYAVGLVASAEWLNAWAAEHWAEFATQDYFDVRALRQFLFARRGQADPINAFRHTQEHGVFASAVFCAPLLLIATTIMLFSLRATVDMMVVTKRLEIKQSRRTQAQQHVKAREDKAQ